MSSNIGTVAVSLKRMEAIILRDSEGEVIAEILPNSKNTGKTHIVVRADRAINISRQRMEPTE